MDMATEEAIVFEGRRWTGASIASSSWGLILRASGRPRAWSTRFPRARLLAKSHGRPAAGPPRGRHHARDRTADGAVRRQARRSRWRIGPPCPRRASRWPPTLPGWGLLIDPLRLIAGAWDDAGPARHQPHDRQTPPRRRPTRRCGGFCRPIPMATARSAARSKSPTPRRA